MPDLSELLAAAAPACPSELDVGAMRRRAERRHRRHAAEAGVAALTVLAVLAGAIGIGVTKAGHSHRKVTVGAGPSTMVTTPTTMTTPTTVASPAGTGDVLRLPLPLPAGVGVGAGSVWVVGGDTAQTRESWYLARLDGVTGAVVSRTELAHPAQSLAVGGGLVWIVGGGDGAYPDGGVTVVDATSGHVLASWGFDQPRATYGIAASGSVGWVSVAAPPSLVRLDLLGRVLRSTTIALSGQPTDVVVTDNHDVWVSVGPSLASRVDTTTNHLVTTVGVPGRFLAAGDRPGVVWSSDFPNRVLVEFDTSFLPALSVGEGVKIPNLAATAAAGTPDGGLFVASDSGVAYYAPSAIGWNGSTVPAPTATLPGSTTLGSATRYLAAAGRSVWFSDQAGGQVIRWTPPQPTRS